MSFWTETVGGGPIHSSSSAYREYEIEGGGALRLSWPLESSTEDVVCDCLAFLADSPAEVLMPDARMGSTGVICEVMNVGLAPVTVKSFVGTTIAVVEPSQVYRLVLRDNQGSGGSWRTVLLGATTAIAQAAGLQSDTVVAQGNTLVQALPLLNIASDYTVSATERGALLNWRGGVGTITLDTVADLQDGWFMHVRNSGDGTLSIVPQAPETIDDAAQVLLNPGQSLAVVCDSTGFLTLLRSGVGAAEGGSAAFSYISIDVTGGGNYVLDANQIGHTAYRFTGALTANRRIIVPAAVAQYWARNQTSGNFTVTVITQSAIDGGRPGITLPQGGSKILYCNGPDVFDASNGGIATPIGVSQGGTGGTSASEARQNLGFSSLGNALATAVSAAAARAALDAMATTNPSTANSLTFTTAGAGPRLSAGGWLYDDSSKQATVLRTNTRRLQVLNSSGAEILLDLDANADRLQFKGNTLLFGGGTGGNVESEIIDALTNPSPQRAYELLAPGDPLLGFSQTFTTVDTGLTSGTSSTYGAKTGIAYLPAKGTKMLCFGSMEFVASGSGVQTIACQIEVMQSGLWVPLASGSLSFFVAPFAPGRYRHPLHFIMDVPPSMVVSGLVQLRIGFHTGGPLATVYAPSLVAIGFGSK